MDQTTDAPPPTPTPEPPPATDTYQRVSFGLRSLRRSKSERVFAGVCGGVARSLGLDPLFVRVLITVLAIVGGAGVLLYVIGWLLLPEDDGTRSVAERAATGTRGSPRPIVLAIALVVATLIGASLVFDHWDGPLLLILLLVGLVVWLDRRSGQQRAVAPASGPPPATGWTAPPPVAAAPPRPRSVLFAVTISCLVIALGILGAVDGGGGDVAGSAYPALGLAVVGAGLVVGAWIGRSRGLIVVGLVLALVTGGAVIGDRLGPIGDDSVDVTLRPTSTDELPDAVEYGVGSATYDLTAVDFSDADATASVSMGAGEIVVIVPRDVDVTATVDIGVGEANLFGAEEGGPGIERTVTDLGGDGAGGGSLDLTLDTGVGHLEVRRG